MRTGIRIKSRFFLLIFSFLIFQKNEMKTNQTKEMDLRQANCVVYPTFAHGTRARTNGESELANTVAITVMCYAGACTGAKSRPHVVAPARS